MHLDLDCVCGGRTRHFQIGNDPGSRAVFVECDVCGKHQRGVPTVGAEKPDTGLVRGVVSATVEGCGVDPCSGLHRQYAGGSTTSCDVCGKDVSWEFEEYEFPEGWRERPFEDMDYSRPHSHPAHRGRSHHTASTATLTGG